ncbi:MAG: DNA polymerase IV [Gammaproteobacteria bacterium]|nr:DNA polymerase IV [Gammaproteobacteria bacterium]
MIIHADMDAYYVSVELLDKPELVDKPVAVGGPSKNRGVISAANYIARKYGVHSALATKTACQRCPNLTLLPARMGVYVDISRKIQAIFARYTPTIEPLSLDEAFLDVSASQKLFGSANVIARNIKQAIMAELKLVVSIGIAPTKFVAKIASDIGKPNGFVIVKKNQVQAFLDPLPVTRIWGVGKATESNLTTLGIKSIHQLRQLPPKKLTHLFGQQGLHLWQLANGIDPRAVITDRHAKSISHEITFATDIDNREYLLAQLLHLTELVAARLREHKHVGRTITIKVRYSDFSTLTRSRSIHNATYNTQPIWKVVKELFTTHIKTNHQALRLVGVNVSGFNKQGHQSPQQTDLFEPQENETGIDAITDAINKRFGENILKRGATIKKTIGPRGVYDVDLHGYHSRIKYTRSD